MTIEWDKNFSVGIKRFDSQHSRLFDIISKLGEAIHTNVERERTFAIIKTLFNESIIHFETEEKALKKYNYPDIEQMHEAHNEFAETVHNLMGKTNNASKEYLVQTFNTLVEWMKTHTTEEDKKYSNFLLNQGMS